MKNFNAIPQIDWARLATWIDAEGCVQISWIAKAGRPRGYHALFVDVGNIDVRVMVWLKETFGGYSNPSKSKSSKRQMFYWRVSTQMAGEILVRCLPYMIVKREQAEVALLFRATFLGGHNTRKLRASVDAEREQYRQKLSALKWGGKSRVKNALEADPELPIQ